MSRHWLTVEAPRDLPVTLNDLCSFITREQQKFIMQGVIPDELVLDENTWAQLKGEFSRQPYTIEPSYHGRLVSLLGMKILIDPSSERRIELR